MIRITINDQTIYSPSIADGGYFALDPVLDKELNNADRLSFVVPRENPTYESIQAMQGIVKVYDDSDRIFHGRVVQTELDFYNQKQITCEGDLAFLNDAVLRPYTYTGSVRGYFTMLINAYNSGVSTDKRLYIGNVTVTDANDTIVRENKDYTTVWSEASDKLLKLLGGYLVTRMQVVNNEERTYIDYLADPGVTGTQVIMFGRNLIDLSNYINGEDLFTRIIPLGARDEDTQEQLTIESVNDNKDYLVDTSAEALYGRIERVAEWDDVTVASNLKTKGQALLSANIVNTQTIEISAVDLHLLDVNTEALKVGNKYRVVSVPHGLTTERNNNLFPLTKASLDLANPANSRYTFGRVQPAISGG